MAFIPFENLGTLELGGQTGNVGKEIYGAGESLWMYLMYEALGRVSDRELMLANLDLLDAFNAKLFPLASSILFCITQQQNGAPLPSRFRRRRDTRSDSVGMDNQLAAQCRSPTGMGSAARGVLNRISLVLNGRKSVLKSWYRPAPFSEGNEHNARRLEFHGLLTKRSTLPLLVLSAVAAIAAPPLAPPFGNWTRLSPDPIVSPRVTDSNPQERSTLRS